MTSRVTLEALEETPEYNYVARTTPDFLALCRSFEAGEIASTYYTTSMFPTAKARRDALWVAQQIGLVVQGAPQ